MDKKIISEVILNCSKIGVFSTDLLKNFITLCEGKRLEEGLSERIWINQSDFLFYGETKYSESEFKEWRASMQTLFGDLPYWHFAFIDRVRTVGDSGSWFATENREVDYLSFWLESELMASEQASDIFDGWLKEKNTHPLLKAFKFEKYEWCDSFLNRKPDLLDRPMTKEDQKSSSSLLGVNQEICSMREVLFKMARTKDGVDWLLKNGVNRKDLLCNVAQCLEVDQTWHSGEQVFSFKEWSSIVRAFPQEMGESVMLEGFLSDFLKGKDLDLNEISKYKRFEDENLASSFYSPLAVFLDFKPSPDLFVSKEMNNVGQKIGKVRGSFGDVLPTEVEATLTHFYLKMETHIGKSYIEDIESCFNKQESFKALVELSFLKADASFLSNKLVLKDLVAPSQILMIKQVYASWMERGELNRERNYTAFKWLKQLAFNGYDLSENELFSGILKDKHTVMGRRLLVDMFQKWAAMQPKDFLSLHLAQFTTKTKFSPTRNCEMNEFLIDLLKDESHKLYPETVEWLRCGLDVAKDLSKNYGPIYEMMEKRILLTQNKEPAAKARKFL